MPTASSTFVGNLNPLMGVSENERKAQLMKEEYKSFMQ